MSYLHTGQIIQGDALEVLPTLPDGGVRLIVTSPPYADARAKQYGGPKPDDYCGWFLPIARELQRVLAMDGTFILNIKEKVVNGERHTYVLDLIKGLREQGWLWTEEYIWHKKNCFPGKWPNRFRDAWERCLQFNKQRNFYMDQDAVRVPAGEWQRSRLVNESRNDGRRVTSKSGSRFGRKVSNWMGRELAYPTNVLRIAPETRNQGHSAPFPLSLPEFFIKLFSAPRDVVLDPFAGSGTTRRSAYSLSREFIGIDLMGEPVCSGQEVLL